MVISKGLIFPICPQRFPSSSSLQFLILISFIRKIMVYWLFKFDLPSFDDLRVITFKVKTGEHFVPLLYSYFKFHRNILMCFMYWSVRYRTLFEGPKFVAFWTFAMKFCWLWSKGSPQETQTVTNKYYFIVTDCVSRSYGIPVAYRDLKFVPCFTKNGLIFRISERGRGQTDT